MEGGTPTFALRDVPLAGHFITFSLRLSVARIDTPPLRPAALAFVSYGFVLVRVRGTTEIRPGPGSIAKAWFFGNEMILPCVQFQGITVL